MKKNILAALFCIIPAAAWADQTKLIDSVVYTNHDFARYHPTMNNKNAYSYDEKGRVSTMIRSQCKDSASKLFPVEKNRYSYNENDSIIKYEQSFTDTADNTWKCHIREFTEFDALGRRVSEERYVLNGEIAPESKKTTRVFTGNNLTELTYYAWNAESKSWQPSEKFSFEYSADNSIASELKSIYTQETWKPAAKATFLYNNSLKTAKTTLTASTDGWSNQQLESWAYTDTFCAEYVRQSWNGSEWIEQEKITYLYNAASQCISQNKLTPLAMEKRQWDDRHKLTLLEQQKYYPECAKWLLTLRDEYTWSYNAFDSVSEIEAKHLAYSINPCYPSSFYPDSKYETVTQYAYDSTNALTEKTLCFQTYGYITPYMKTQYARNEIDGTYAVRSYSKTSSSWQLQDETITYYRTSADTIPAPTQQVYPNPVGNHIFVTIAGNEKGEVKIYDVNASLVLTAELPTAVSQINTSALPDGIYYLKVSDSRGTNTYKILKQ